MFYLYFEWHLVNSEKRFVVIRLVLLLKFVHLIFSTLPHVCCWFNEPAVLVSLLSIANNLLNLVCYLDEVTQRLLEVLVRSPLSVDNLRVDRHGPLRLIVFLVYMWRHRLILVRKLFLHHGHV